MTSSKLLWCAQADRVLDALSEKFPWVAEHFDAARADVLASTVSPASSGARPGRTAPASARTPSRGYDVVCPPAADALTFALANDNNAPWRQRLRETAMVILMGLDFTV